MRITKKPEERRNEILDTAEMFFTTKGYAKTTINDILREIGIAKGTFYYYFQSKEEVMDAVVQRFIGVGVEKAEAIASDPNMDAHAKILQILMAQQPEAIEHKASMIEELHQVQNAEMHQKSITESVLQLAPILTEAVKQGIQENVFHTDYPQEAVEVLLISSSMLFDEGIFQWQPAELSKKIAGFINTLERLLGAEKGSFAYVQEMMEQHTKEEH